MKKARPSASAASAKRTSASSHSPGSYNAEPIQGIQSMTVRLKEQYTKEVRKKLQDEFQIKNPMAVPKVEKVVVNMGVGEAIQNAKLLDTAVEELSTITGQKPVVTKAKKSSASVKLREGTSIATMFTLGGEKMSVFLDRFID